MKKSGILNFKMSVASYCTTMSKKRRRKKKISTKFQVGNPKGNIQAQTGGCSPPD
jgi:hypothetical protein